MIPLFFVVFAILHGPRGDSAGSYEGMDQATIVRLAAERGETVQFVDKQTHDDFVTVHTQAATGVNPVRAVAQAQARLDVKNASLSQQKRFQALLLLMDLDL